MKQIGNKKIVKEIKTFRLNESVSNVSLVATYENGKVREAVLNLKKGTTSIKHLHPTVVTPKFWEYIKSFNPWWEIKHKYGWQQDLVIEPKDLLKLDRVESKDIVLTYGEGHLIFDLDENPIPTPYGFDYIGTPFSSKKSDLVPLLEHLKKHPMVLNGDDLYIEEVPYYNNEDGTEKYIRGKELPWIVILPHQETMTRLFKEGTERDKEFFSVRMKDILMGDWLMYLSELQGHKKCVSSKFDPLGIRPFLKSKDEIEY